MPKPKCKCPIDCPDRSTTCRQSCEVYLRYERDYTAWQREYESELVRRGGTAGHDRMAKRAARSRRRR